MPMDQREMAERLEANNWGDWGRLKREGEADWRNQDRRDPLEHVASRRSESPEGTALMLLSHPEDVIKSREELETLISIAREPHLNASESAEDAGLSRSGFRSLQYRAKKRWGRKPPRR